MEVSVSFEENIRKTTIKDSVSKFQAIVRDDGEIIHVKIFDGSKFQPVIYEEKEVKGLTKLKRLGNILDTIIRCVAKEAYARSPNINDVHLNKEKGK